MEAKIVESELYDDVITLEVNKADFQKLFGKRINHIWIEHIPTELERDNSQAGIQAFRVL